MNYGKQGAIRLGIKLTRPSIAASAWNPVFRSSFAMCADFLGAFCANDLQDLPRVSSLASAILELPWSQLDLDKGTICFRADGEHETNKRRGRIRIPRQLWGHLRRWKLYRGDNVVTYRGRPVRSIKTGIRRAAERAELEGVTPHALKHTAITWAIANGLSVGDAAEYFNTSPYTIREHYWHHSPYHLGRALAVIEQRRNCANNCAMQGGNFG